MDWKGKGLQGRAWKARDPTSGCVLCRPGTPPLKPSGHGQGSCHRPWKRRQGQPGGRTAAPSAPGPHTLTACTQEAGWRRFPLRSKFIAYKIKSEMLSEANTRIQRSASLPTSSSSPGSAVTGNRSPRPPISPKSPPKSPPVSDANQSHCLAPQGRASAATPGADAVPAASPAPPLDCDAQPHGAPQAPFIEVWRVRAEKCPLMYTRLLGTGFIYLVQEKGIELPMNPVPFLGIQWRARPMIRYLQKQHLKIKFGRL